MTDHAEEARVLHRQLKGGIHVQSKFGVWNKEDLPLVYWGV